MKINLNGKWRFKKVADSNYRNGSVPGGIMNDLLENGMADDPYYRDNEYAAYELFRHDYEYTREIAVDKKVLDKDSIRLICDGIDTLSEIYLNEKLIARTDNMHRRWVFDIKPYLAEVNVIKIIIKSPVDFIEKAWTVKNDIWGVCAKDGYQYIRKAHYMFGWDWGPAIPDGGIWRD
ncbi:MAG: glycoside hydrolase family 2 protein, partial [Clostridia bacterium]|nr:glycoside hydrolase family 2 protein [Clostridia bacterium]